MRWWRHPIEAFRWWLHKYDEPDWRTRLLKPFLLSVRQPTVATYQMGDVLETWEYCWKSETEVEELVAEGWESAGIHPVHDLPGRRSRLMRRRIK